MTETIHTTYRRFFMARYSLMLCMFFTALNATTLHGQNQLDTDSKMCLECHSKFHYTLVDPVYGDEVVMKIYDEIRINPEDFLRSAHGSFSCIDCHSMDYEIHPHPLEAKFEPLNTCIDCHGTAEQFADFNFHTIEREFQMSVHGDHYIENFSCWSCHDPHTYRMTARLGGSIMDIVAYNNSMCLDCHGDISHYAVLIERQLTNMLSKHDWLPNQSLHFRKVRCIDCHATVHDDIHVAHQILPADQAVRNCVECHSTNSILLASLYRHKVIERRNQYGFFNAAITGDAYIIGANRNYYFNVISIVILGLVLLGIAVHATLRYINYRRSKSK